MVGVEVLLVVVVVLVWTLCVDVEVDALVVDPGKVVVLVEVLCVDVEEAEHQFSKQSPQVDELVAQWPSTGYLAFSLVHQAGPFSKGGHPQTGK